MYKIAVHRQPNYIPRAHLGAAGPRDVQHSLDVSARSSSSTLAIFSTGFLRRSYPCVWRRLVMSPRQDVVACRRGELGRGYHGASQQVPGD